MTTVATSIPDDLHLNLHQGEEVQFHALVQTDGSFLVTSLLCHQPVKIAAPQASEAQKTQTIGDWARKWAGIAAPKPGQVVADLKRAAYQQRFGS